MNPEIKRQWLRDLRSGEYQQGRYALKQITNGQVIHCCLGVLCEQAEAAGIVIGQEDENHMGDFIFASTNRPLSDYSKSDLPNVAAEWAGLVTGDPEVVVDDGCTVTLANLNDYGMSFVEISDIIERHL